MPTNDTEKLIRKQIDILSRSLRSDLEKHTQKLVGELGDVLGQQISHYLADILTQQTASHRAGSTPLIPTNTHAAAATQQLATVAFNSALRLFNRGPRIRTNTQESSRSVDEQEKFRASRSQTMYDISAQLSLGEKNS